MAGRVVEERLVDIEVVLAGLGFAAAADASLRSLTAVRKASPGVPDPGALWRLIASEPAATFSERELLSDDYLFIALERVLGR